MVPSPFDQIAHAILEGLEAAVATDDPHCVIVHDGL